MTALWSRTMNVPKHLVPNLSNLRIRWQSWLSINLYHVCKFMNQNIWDARSICYIDESATSLLDGYVEALNCHISGSQKELMGSVFSCSRRSGHPCVRTGAQGAHSECGGDGSLHVCRYLPVFVWCFRRSGHPGVRTGAQGAHSECGGDGSLHVCRYLAVFVWCFRRSGHPGVCTGAQGAHSKCGGDGSLHVCRYLPVFVWCFRRSGTSGCLYRSPRRTQRVWRRWFASCVSVFTCVCLMFQEIRDIRLFVQEPKAYTASVGEIVHFTCVGIYLCLFDVSGDQDIWVFVQEPKAYTASVRETVRFMCVSI